jgi:hypothetical protein
MDGWGQQGHVLQLQRGFQSHVVPKGDQDGVLQEIVGVSLGLRGMPARHKGWGKGIQANYGTEQTQGCCVSQATQTRVQRSQGWVYMCPRNIPHPHPRPSTDIQNTRGKKDWPRSRVPKRLPLNSTPNSSQQQHTVYPRSWLRIPFHSWMSGSTPHNNTRCIRPRATRFVPSNGAGSRGAGLEQRGDGAGAGAHLTGVAHHRQGRGHAGGGCHRLPGLPLTHTMGVHRKWWRGRERGVPGYGTASAGRVAWVCV